MYFLLDNTWVDVRFYFCSKYSPDKRFSFSFFFLLETQFIKIFLRWRLYPSNYDGLFIEPLEMSLRKSTFTCSLSLFFSILPLYNVEVVLLYIHNFLFSKTAYLSNLSILPNFYDVNTRPCRPKACCFSFNLKKHPCWRLLSVFPIIKP